MRDCRIWPGHGISPAGQELISVTLAEKPIRDAELRADVNIRAP